MPSKQEFEDPEGDHYYAIPTEYRWAGRLLYRLKARFEEQSWPATWTLLTEADEKGQGGSDFWLHFDFTKFNIGIEYEFLEPYANSHDEWHRNIRINIGPFTLDFHWWRFPKDA